MESHVIKILIPSPLQKYVNHEIAVCTKATNISEALDNLIQTYPLLRSYLYDHEGKYSGFIQIYLNEEKISAKDICNVKLNKNDVVSLLIGIAGG